MRREIEKGKMKASGHLEDAFLNLTGRDMRVEDASSLDHMRSAMQMVSLWSAP